MFLELRRHRLTHSVFEYLTLADITIFGALLHMKFCLASFASRMKHVLLYEYFDTCTHIEWSKDR